jgi:hypothetical protein
MTISNELSKKITELSYKEDGKLDGRHIEF